MRSIRRQLLVWLLGGVLVSTLIAGAMMFIKVREETGELFDDQLRLIATSLPTRIVVQHQAEEEDDELNDDISVQIWDLDGKLVYSANAGPGLPRPAFRKEGHHSVSSASGRWQVFTEIRRGHLIQVARASRDRDRLAMKLALRSLLPFMVLIPLLGLFILLVVSRGLRPLAQLARAVGRQSPSALKPLPLAHVPPEIRPVVLALNDLLARLEQAMSAQRSFVADAAHELRTPLTALKLQLQLAERAGDDVQRAEAFARLGQRLDRASHLVRQLLTLARHEPQMGLPQRAPVDLVALAGQVIADYDDLAREQGIDLGLNAGDDIGLEPGNGDSLAILLDNLVRNALAHTPAGGRVDVVLARDGGHAELRVIDTGPGIPPAVRQRVFDRFYRCGDRGNTGSGLGLAIVKSIADAHGARVTLADNPGAASGLMVSVRFGAGTGG